MSSEIQSTDMLVGQSYESDVDVVDSGIEIEQQLRTSIDACGEAFGAFAADGVVHRHAFPQLTIDGIDYDLPFSTNVIQELVNTSEKAPFGFGHDTIHDDTVRSTWQIDAKRLGLQTRDWANLITLLVQQAVHGLGKAYDHQSFSAQPHKLLIYQPGDGFKPHKESVRAHKLRHLHH
jgi:hypothetical protein